MAVGVDFTTLASTVGAVAGGKVMLSGARATPQTRHVDLTRRAVTIQSHRHVAAPCQANGHGFVAAPRAAS